MRQRKMSELKHIDKEFWNQVGTDHAMEEYDIEIKKLTNRLQTALENWALAEKELEMYREGRQQPSKEQVMEAVMAKKDSGGHIYADGVNDGLDIAIKALEKLYEVSDDNSNIS